MYNLVFLFLILRATGVTNYKFGFFDFSTHWMDATSSGRFVPEGNICQEDSMKICTCTIHFDIVFYIDRFIMLWVFFTSS